MRPVAAVASMPRTGWFEPVAVFTFAKASAVAGDVMNAVMVEPTVSARLIASAAKSRFPNADPLVRRLPFLD